MAQYNYFFYLFGLFKKYLEIFGRMGKKKKKGNGFIYIVASFATFTCKKKVTGNIYFKIHLSGFTWAK